MEATMTDELLSDATPAPKGDDAPEETLETVRDVTPTQDPKTFDIAAFVAGIRPTRRAVTIYSRGDLVAQADLLKTRIRESEDLGRPTKERTELRAELKAVTEEMTLGCIDVVVEGRSSEWVQKLNKALTADGVTDAIVRSSHIIAEQVVEPAGLTAELLEQIRAVSEPQWVELSTATTTANQERVSPDFSRGRSGATRR